VYGCPPGALNATWEVGNDAEGARMESSGNGCFMRYAFTGTSISVDILTAWNSWLFSCAIDGSTPQYFSSNGGTVSWGAGCIISGLPNKQHTIVIRNGPLPGWWIAIGNILVTTSNAPSNNTNTFTSIYDPYELPSAFSVVATAASASGSASNSTVPTVTVTSVPAGWSKDVRDGVPLVAVAVACSILGLVSLLSSALALVFWRRGRDYLGKYQRIKGMEAAPEPYPKPSSAGGHSRSSATTSYSGHRISMTSFETPETEYEPYTAPPEYPNSRPRKH